jgi:hypothetical protein
VQSSGLSSRGLSFQSSFYSCSARPPKGNAQCPSRTQARLLSPAPIRALGWPPFLYFKDKREIFFLSTPTPQSSHFLPSFSSCHITTAGCTRRTLLLCSKGCHEDSVMKRSHMFPQKSTPFKSPVPLGLTASAFGCLCGRRGMTP